VAILVLAAAATGVWLSRDRRAGPKPGFVASLLFWLNEDTRFAPGYTEKAFHSIAVGDPESRVTNLLGAPLSVYTNEIWTGWVYAGAPLPDYAATGEIGMDASATWFVFTPAGRVISVDGQLSAPGSQGSFSSTRSISTGPGMNFLKLSPEQIADLKGKTRAEIEAKFGKPTAVRESRAARRFFYSDSPSSANYRQRVIGIDADGKVVELDDRLYFD
jgi:hypothetical protein